MMKGWTRLTLGELCKTHGGKIQTGPFGSQLHQSDYVDEGVSVVMPKDINQQGIDLSFVAKISTETAERLSRHKLHKDEIVFPRRGEITKCALIKQEQEGFLCGTGCLKITVPAKALNPLFFRYYLAKKEIIEWLDGNAVGATMKNLSTGILQKLPVVYPALHIQQKIAKILAAYDDLIENNLKRIKLLEEMAQITYEEWFVRLRFPGHESTPINPETGLPDGWSKIKLKAVLTLNYGKALKADTRAEGDIPVYGSSGIVGTHNVALVKGCGIIVGRKGNVGSVFWSHDSFYPIDTVYFVTSKHTLPFLYFALKNSRFNNSDAAVPGLNRDAAYAVEIMLPPEAVEKQFSSMAQKNFKAIQLLEMKNQRLREARDILLPRLMTGMIDVENYDPAQLLKEAA